MSPHGQRGLRRREHWRPSNAIGPPVAAFPPVLQAVALCSCPDPAWQTPCFGSVTCSCGRGTPIPCARLLHGGRSRRPLVACLSYSPSAKPTRQLLHRLPMHDTAPPGHNPRHHPPMPSPYQGHVRAAVMRDHLDVFSHVPADFSTAMGLVKILLVAAGLELLPVIGQDIGGNDLGSFSSRHREQHSRMQSMTRESELGTHFAKTSLSQTGERLFDGQARLAGEVAVGVDRDTDSVHQFANVDQHRNAGRLC